MATQKTGETAKKKATSPKRSTTKAAVKKPVAAGKSAQAKMQKVSASGEVSKKELVERLVAETGLRKGDARTAVNGLLSVLHDAIAEGKNVSAAPLGKLKIVRKKQTPNGELAVLRVKLRGAAKTDGQPAAQDAVADPAE